MFSGITLAQLNFTVGDIAGNTQKIRESALRAKAHNADLVIYPELSITGYPPEDLILKPAFQKAAMEAIETLATETGKQLPALLVGGIFTYENKVYNSAFLLDEGRVLHVIQKASLPNYGVFDEKRIFCAGGYPTPVEWRGKKLGILVCEDLWHADISQHLKQQGAECLIVINASPFEKNKLATRHIVAREAVNSTGLPLLYVNMIGGQDDIIFDGGSFVMNNEGQITQQLPEFNEQLAPYSASQIPLLSEYERLWHAAALGLGDYVRKNKFPGVLLGLSGGIDSAVVAALAVDALGKDNVIGVLLPSPYTSLESIEDAENTASLLGIRTHTLPINPLMESFAATLKPEFHQLTIPHNWMENVAIGGNLQARIRAILLMALSNANGQMLLNTSNKSEIAVGYSTLYGDSCGGYAPLKDLYKTEIYTLAHWRNGLGRVIPEQSISKAPSAELKPDQKDEDQLPPYEILDRLLQLLIEERGSADEAIQKGFSPDTVHKVIKLIQISEYKRRQSPPGGKLTSMLFGRDRRYPLTNLFSC